MFFAIFFIFLLAVFSTVLSTNSFYFSFLEHNFLFFMKFFSSSNNFSVFTLSFSVFFSNSFYLCSSLIVFSSNNFLAQICSTVFFL